MGLVFLISVSEIKKLKPKKAEALAQSHIARKEADGALQRLH